MAVDRCAREKEATLDAGNKNFQGKQGSGGSGK